MLMLLIYVKSIWQKLFITTLKNLKYNVRDSFCIALTNIQTKQMIIKCYSKDYRILFVLNNVVVNNSYSYSF